LQNALHLPPICLGKKASSSYTTVALLLLYGYNLLITWHKSAKNGTFEFAQNCCIREVKTNSRKKREHKVHS